MAGQRQERAQIGLGLLGNADERLAAMTHLHDRHAATAPIEHFGRRLLQHDVRQHRGTRAEIEDSHEVVPRLVQGGVERPPEAARRVQDA